MSDIDAWIYDRLNTDVAALEGRITPETGDQESGTPYIVVKLITEDPYATHDVPLQLTRHWHYQLCAFAGTFALARSIGEAAKAALVGQHGSGIQSVLLQGGTRRGLDPQTGEREYSFDVSIWENLSLVLPVVEDVVSGPLAASAGFTATDGSGSAFNTSTISIPVSGADTLLLAFAHVEFNDAGDQNWEFTFNGINGRQFFDTDGYSGGLGNRRLRAFYWTAPTAGTHNLVVQITAAPGVAATLDNELAVAAVLVTGAAQTFYPFRSTGKDISATPRSGETETVTSSVTDLVLHAIAHSISTPGTLGAGETLIVNANDGDGDASVLVSKKAGAASVTVSSSGWANTFALEGLAMSIMAAGAVEDHTVYRDSLTRANESPLSNAATWTQPAGSANGTVAIVSNKAAGTGGAENIAIVSTPVFPADQRAQIAYAGGQYTQVWVRVTDSGGYCLTTAGPSVLQVHKVANSGSGHTFTKLGADILPVRNIVAGELLELEVTGTTLNVYFNGQFIATRTDATYATGQPGLGSFGAIDIATSFEATSLPARN